MNNPAIYQGHWPPPYTIKKHAKARHVRMKASVRHGLELVVPTRFNLKEIPGILDTHREWIQKNLALIWDKFQENQAQALPLEIDMKAMGIVWKIIYLESASEKIKLHLRPQNELILLGKISDKALCMKMILKWVKKEASAFLLRRLREMSLAMGVPYSTATIRNQRARWGSCSKDKEICLNYKLLFLPRGLMEHIIIHELCHTLQLDHSAKFWGHVASFDLQWKENKKAMRDAEGFMPAWID